MTYTLSASLSVVIRDADGANIPNDPRNVDWQAYQAWLTAGNQPTPYTPPPPAPPTLSYEQFRRLFMKSEIQVIMTAAQYNSVVSDWLLRAVGAGAINLADPQVMLGVNYLAAPPPYGPGLITPIRAAEILSGSQIMYLSASGICAST